MSSLDYAQPSPPRAAPFRDSRRDGDRHRQRRLARTRELRRRKRRQRALLTCVLLLLPVLVSYVSALARPSNVGVGMRSVEWLRDHGGAWLVSDAERFWYSLTAPGPGGPPLTSLPRVGVRGAVAGSAGSAAGYAPPQVQPVISPALPGEGSWRPTGQLVRGRSPVLVTTLRPDAAYPELVAGLAWIDHTRTRLSLYPGRYEPASSTLRRGPLEVPSALRGGLLATFNSGFKLADSHGGFYAAGQLAAPLAAGKATLLGYRDGRVDVRAWHGGPAPGPEVSFARQNLPLIVDGGRPNPNLADGPAWGRTLGNTIKVWRSAVGVDRHGNLIYAAGNYETVAGLAHVLLRAGAVRAMQLDINADWVTFNAYARPGTRNAFKLLPDMTRPTDRYLSPDDRDFFAVYRPAGG
jgi:hypothetical protein